MSKHDADYEQLPSWLEKARPILLANIQRYGVSAADSEDVLQDVLMGILPYLPEIESYDKFRAFAIVRARWRAFDMLRSRSFDHASRGEPLDVALERPDSATPESYLQQRQFLAEIRKLPPRSRQVVELAAQGMTSTGIAREMKITPSAARSLLRYARHQLALVGEN